MGTVTSQQTSNVEPLGGRYEVLDLVGEGAAAWVYRVRDTRSGAIRAAKVLKPEGVSKPEVLRRYEDEYRVLRQLHHPSLPEVYDYGWLGEDGRYIIMEYVDGQPLDAHFREHPEDLWVLTYELCEVLDFIHDHDLLHQDIKPSNILVRRTGAYGRELPIVTLIDFGLLHRREPGERAQMVGTVAYMAPEVISGAERLTRAVDYYSLGVSLYELLAGGLPFEGTARDVVAGHLNGEPTFEEEQLEWAEVYPHVLELLAKDVNTRLEGFENLHRAAVSRMTGGIEELEKAYGLSWVNSVELVSDTQAWRTTLAWITSIARQSGTMQAEPRTSMASPKAIADKGTDSWSELLRADRAHDRQKPVPEDMQLDAGSDVEAKRTQVIVGPIASGKSYFTESILGEAAILGLSVFRLGQRSDYQELSQHLSNLTIEARRAEVWRRIETMAEARGCVVHSDHAETLTEEEQSFAEYVDTRLSIMSDRRQPSAIYSLRQMRATSARGRRHEVLTTSIEPPSEQSIGQIIDIFRGRVPSARALEAIRVRALHASRSSGMLIETIRRDFVSGRIRYHGHKWLVDRDLTLREVQPAHGVPLEELLKLLSSDEQEFFEALAAHPGYASSDDIVAVTGLPVHVVVRCASQLEAYGLAQVERSSGAVAAARSISLQASHLVSPAIRRRVHGNWIARISDLLHVDDPVRLSQLAFHYQQIGEYRDAVINYIRAVRAAEHTGLRDVLHVACERAARLCASKRAQRAETEAASARRWLLKKRVLAYWKEQNYPRILSLVDEFALGPEPLPVSVMPIVAYAMIVSRSPTDGKVFIDRCRGELRLESPVGARLEVMRGLAEHSVKQNQMAQSCLARARRNIQLLDTEYRSRLFLYMALVTDDLGEREETRKYLRKARSYARALGEPDLIAVAEAARAVELFTAGKLKAAKRVIADGLRLAGRHGLIRRMGQFHFNASAVYYELDDYDRALRHLEQATRLSEALAERNRVGMLSIRYGMLHQQMGQLGTAVHHVDTALRMSRRVDDPEVDLVARLTRLDVALQLHEESASSRLRFFDAGRGLRGDVSRRGWLETLRGEKWRYQGDCARALRNYRAARRIYSRAGWNDDAARVMLKEAAAQLELGNSRACEKLLEMVRSILGRIENPLVRAEARLVELLLAFSRRDGKSAVRGKARACETERTWIKQADLALRIDEALIRVYARVGYRAGAARAAERYMRQLRMQIANAMEYGVGRKMTSRPDIAALLGELRVLKRKGLLS